MFQVSRSISEVFHFLPFFTTLQNALYLVGKIYLLRIKSFCQSAINFFFYLDAPNAVHVKYSCLVSNGIKKGHLLVSCSHQSGKAPLASANGSCSSMQGKKSVSNIRVRLSKKVCNRVQTPNTPKYQVFTWTWASFFPPSNCHFFSLPLNAMNEKFREFLGLEWTHSALAQRHKAVVNLWDMYYSSHFRETRVYD